MDLKGKLLVASPILDETPMEQTVILILQNDKTDGTIGVLINQPADQTIKNAWAQFAGGAHFSQKRLRFGGPNSGPVVAVHTTPEFADGELSNAVFTTTTQRKMRSIIQQEQSPFRVYFGILGWDQSELNDEMERGFWHTVDCTQQLLFEATESLWHSASQARQTAFFESVCGIDPRELDSGAN